MALPYLIAIVAAIAMAAGAAGMHRYDQAELLAMQNAVQAQKVEAANVLAAETASVNAANLAAIAANQQLEKSHAQSLDTINALHDSLATARMYDPGRRPSRHCPATASADPGISATDTDTAELSAELTRFLAAEARRADLAAEYATACHQFAVINHCGIAPPVTNNAIQTSSPG